MQVVYCDVTVQSICCLISDVGFHFTIFQSAHWKSFLCNISPNFSNTLVVIHIINRRTLLKALIILFLNDVFYLNRRDNAHKIFASSPVSTGMVLLCLPSYANLTTFKNNIARF